MLLVLYLKNSLGNLISQLFLVCFLQEVFIILHFMSRPVIHFELLFIKIQGIGRSSFVCICTSSCFHSMCWQDYFISIELSVHLKKNQLITFVWICFGTLCAVLLILCLPLANNTLSHWLDYCRFRVTPDNMSPHKF